VSKRRPARPSIPARLRGKHPRSRTGKFLSASAAKRQRAYYAPKPKPRARKPAPRPSPRRPFKLARERDIRPKKRASTRRPAPPRPAPRPAGGRVDHILSFSFRAGARSYRRDLIVPAPRGTSVAALVKQARAELPSGAASLRDFLTPAHATAFEGPDTRRTKTELR
jgi:hypothetical protein